MKSTEQMAEVAMEDRPTVTLSVTVDGMLAYRLTDTADSDRFDAVTRSVARVISETGRDTRVIGPRLRELLRAGPPAIEDEPDEIDAVIASIDAEIAPEEREPEL